MPRKGRGGKVEGVDQTAYSNRSDLNNRGPQPITAAPGEPYGQRKMLEDAQRAVPMAGTATPAMQMPTAAPTAPTAPGPIPHGGAGNLGFWDEVPHPPLAETLAMTSKGNTGQQGMANINQALDNAAASPYATRAVQELAGFAKTLGM